ncbi:MAG: hypothetical protein NZ898_14380 [Myxococcota bacterium]|nr:hypothetical protein [Myxococcota bacterium]MDW8360848.1 hypothetical protein [Myxococcales bacterium]
MRPIEWLEALGEPGAYDRLLHESGTLALAAWRLASARCATREVATSWPTRLELRAAAREIARRVHGSLAVPASRVLAEQCESAGLPVI